MKHRGLILAILTVLATVVLGGCGVLGGNEAPPTAGEIFTVVGPADIDGNNISGLAASDNGDIYFSVDRRPGMVKKFGQGEGSVETVVGGGAVTSLSENAAGKDIELSEPMGLALDRDGNLIVADKAAGRVLRWDPDGDAVTVLAEIREPTDVAVLGDGRIAVCSGTFLRVLEPSNGDLHLLSSVPCWDVAVTGEGKFWTAGANNYGRNDGRLVETDPETGEARTLAGQAEQDLFASDSLLPIGNCGPIGDARMMGPQSVASTPSGDMYIYDSSEARAYVRRVDVQTGIIETVVGPPGNGYRDYTGDRGPALEARLAMRDSARISTDGSGNLYISGPDHVRKVLAPIPGSCD